MPGISCLILVRCPLAIAKNSSVGSSINLMKTMCSTCFPLILSNNNRGHLQTNIVHKIDLQQDSTENNHMIKVYL